MRLRFLLAKFPVACHLTSHLHLLLCLMLSGPVLAGGSSTPTNWPSPAGTSPAQEDRYVTGTTVIELQPDLQTEAQTDTPQTEPGTTEAPTQRTTSNYTGKCCKVGELSVCDAGER